METLSRDELCASDDIKWRMASACTAFGRLKEKISGTEKTFHTTSKTPLYDAALVITIVNYAWEKHILRLLVFTNKYLRAIRGEKYHRQNQNDFHKEKARYENSERRKLIWLGHVIKREESFVYIERSYKDNFPGKRSHGRPPKRLEDQIKEDTRMPLLILWKDGLG